MGGKALVRLIFNDYRRMNLAVFSDSKHICLSSSDGRELLTFSDKIYRLICSVHSFIDLGKLIKRPFHMPALCIRHLSQEQQVPLKNL